MQWAFRLPQMPYHVRDLFPQEHPKVSMAVFSVLLVWVGLAPAWVGDFLARRPRLWATVIGLVSWSMLRFAVTRESLWDVLGSQTLGWGGDWELLCRFIALQGTVTLVLIVSGVLAGSVRRLGWRGGLRRGGLALLWGAPWLVLAWTAVVGWADTDNLTELIRATPWTWVGPAFLTALLLLIAFSASALSHAWSRRGLTGKLVATGAALVAVGPGWGLFWLGLVPAVEKYEMTFPAVRFLLGPDRGTPMALSELAFRWGAVQIGAVVVLGVGGLIALCLRPGHGESPPHHDDELAVEQHGPNSSRRWRRVYLALASAWAAFLVYGSMIPLAVQSMPFEDALTVFTEAMQSPDSRWSQSDMVTNITMLVPLTFFALGAWSYGRPRGRYWLKMPIIFASGVVLTFAMEFSQVFLPDRTTSVHDVIAQAIGNALGLAAWAAFGVHLTRWIGRMLVEKDRPTLCMKLLYTYAAVLLIYSILPLNFTISVGKIWHKYKSGMINLIPFAGAGEPAVLASVMKTALYVPVGFMFACRSGRSGRPILAAVAGGGLFAAGMEVLQVLVMARIATVTDVVLGVIGALVGGLFAWRLGPIAVGQGVHGRKWQRWGTWLKLPLVVGWLVLLAYLRWDGFDGGGVGRTLAQGLERAFQAPLGGMVYSAGPLDAIPRLAQEFSAFLIFGMLWQAMLASSGRRRLLALGVSVALVLVIECGGLMFSRSAPEILLSVTALAGVVASYWLHHRFVAVFLTPAGSSGQVSAGPDEGAGP